MARLGVFVCHCGENIARTVRTRQVVDEARRVPGVAFAADYPYLCSAPGQKLVMDSIREHDLGGVVVAACSPQLHEPTFRTAVAAAGLNPFLCEMANIREHCSWVHPDIEEATLKACQTVASTAVRLQRSSPLEPLKVPVTDRALVIGGGVAGLRAALDIANAGHPVVLVEKGPSLGGNMARLAETFPTLDCSQCILTPLMVETARHPLIEMITYAEVDEVTGFVGNFVARIRTKPRFVVAEDCTGCGDCAAACPESTPNEFEMGLSARKAIYIPFPQAVPAVFTLDPESCLNAKLDSPTGFRVLACARCNDVCVPKAIDFDMRSEIVERNVGVIVVATGYSLIDAERFPEYGYGVHPDVLSGLEFERLLSATGPTGGEILRPSNGATPQDVVFIQCVGSRDPAHGVSYCSRVCCMYTAKHALLLKHKVPDAQAYVFYMDIRAAGKGYEEFVHRVMEDERVLYVRGRVGRVVPRDGRLEVTGVDTLAGLPIRIPADMVVLATALTPADDGTLAGTLRASIDPHGFLQEAHPKLRPVETLTAGIFLAGTSQSPKDIPDTVAQASASASKSLELLSRPALERDPATAVVAAATCAGCFECLQVCPYGAIERHELRDGTGDAGRLVARVNGAVCEGCGGCVVTCRSGNIDLVGCTDEQVFAQLSALGPLESAAER